MLRLPHLKIHQVLCGLAAAVAIAALPLPALADETSTTNTPTASQAQSAAPADAQTTPTTPLANGTIDTAGSLQPTIDNAVSPSISLSGNDAAATATAVVDIPSSNPAATVQVTNDLASDTTSGMAVVTENKQAGNATSGNAQANATVLNVANANGLSAGDFTTFQCDVDGDVQNDLIIDPTSLLPICETTTVGSPQQPGASQNLQTGASLIDILNTIVLNANSGNATVSNNEDAGDATSGNASALANIMNIANSSVTAKNSFLGVINIYGTLKGNILVPQSIVDSLVTPSASGHNGNTTDISNNTNANATSGNATVSNNEDAGDATSGNAATNITVYNLTGQQVVAKNSLLVFVNIMGQWTGLIVPAGAGNNSAVLGSGIQTSNASLGSTTGNSNVNITNNVSLNAQSGNAAVDGNEKAGNATSGNAQAGATLVNITDSNFWLDDWFGALFINVLGSWFGNFDIQALMAATPDGEQPITGVQVYQFDTPAEVAPAPIATQTASTTSNNGRADIEQISQQTGTVLAATNEQALAGDDGGAKPVKLDILALGAVVMGLTMMIATATMVMRRWHISA